MLMGCGVPSVGQTRARFAVVPRAEYHALAGGKAMHAGPVRVAVQQDVGAGFR